MKIVRYIDCANVLIGEQASVMCVDHPTAPNREWLRTTPVVAIEPTGIGPAFTTRNTLYVPYEQPQIVRVEVKAWDKEVG